VGLLIILGGLLGRMGGLGELVLFYFCLSCVCMREVEERGRKGSRLRGSWILIRVLPGIKETQNRVQKTAMGIVGIE